MDRGAARSRKRALKLEQPTRHARNGPTAAGPSRPPKPQNRPGLPSAGEGEAGPSSLLKKLVRGPSAKALRRQKHEDASDADRFKPKAVRTSTALIWSQEPFAIPPPADKLSGITRLDLSGSGVEDISWISGAKGVTWLSLAGCKVSKGWEAVRELADLAVLNISDTRLKKLPDALGNLHKLKAVVAMNNPWKELDEGVVDSWTELNSLIISHSPALTRLPSALSTLSHLSKLTFSHCPVLRPSGLPDLSPLPLLRDVKMNHLPLLTSVPPHLAAWGTGELSSVGKTGKGEGLEVLDLGNCALSTEAAAPFFHPAARTWAHLRSLTLRGNPLAESEPEYVERLQAALPGLQIVDSKRVKEPKRAGEKQETREEKRARERKEGKMRPSGVNAGAIVSGKKRAWGEVGHADEDDNGAEAEMTGQREHRHKERSGEKISQGKEQRKRRKREYETAAAERGGGEDGKPEVKGLSKDKQKPTVPSVPNNAAAVKPQTKTGVPPSKTPTTQVTEKPTPVVDPSTAKPSAPRASKTETSIVQVIDVPRASEQNKKVSKKGKHAEGKKESGGVDLRTAFSAPVVDQSTSTSGTGLGVGGW